MRLDQPFDPALDYDLLPRSLRDRLEDQPLIDVWLHGPLGDKYGAMHRLAVRNPREAVAALNANYPGFLADFAASERYQIQVDGELRGGALAALGPAAAEIHFIPQVEGGGFLAVPLITAAAGAMGIALSATAASIIGGVLVTGLLVGLSLLFQPKKPTKKDDETTRESFSFTGPDNVVAQGVAVPVVYGRCMCGSVVASVGVETDNQTVDIQQLVSAQMVRIVDIISEGLINRIVGGYQGVYLDGVRYQNPDGSFNFPLATFYILEGYRGQPLIPGQYWVERETVVNTRVKYGQPVVRQVIDPDVDRIRFTVSVPALYNADNDHGEYNPEAVVLGITVPGYVYGWNLVGKTTSRYQSQVILDLPPGGAPWTISVARNGPDSSDPKIANDTYWDSYTELYNERVNYNLTAVMGVRFNAETFDSIPKRTYDIEGLIILVPTNYDPRAATYSGAWDGTFKAAWSDNPAWVFYDLVTNNRYGLGSFVPPSSVDKFFLYSVAQWCDGLVPNGHGGLERRFRCNVQITDQQEAFDLLNRVASCFRGFSYWAGGMLRAIADQPAQPVTQFTNADVIDGQFSYQGSDIRARHTQATASWSDQSLIGETRIAIAEDPLKLSVLGINRVDAEAFGATTESQALRYAKWALYTELYEAEAISFQAGLKGSFLEPGQIIRVADINIAGQKTGGRVTAASASNVTFDAPVNAGSSTPSGVYLSCVMPSGAVETQLVVAWAPDNAAATVSPAFSAAPPPDTPFVISAPGGLEPTLWRLTQITQTDPDRYDITGVRHLPDKWKYVEQGIAITEPDITDIMSRYPAVTNLAVQEYLIALSPISVGVRVTLSWTSMAPAFDVSWREQNGNWVTRRVTTTATDIDVEEGWYDFRVIPISTLGLRGAPATISYQVIGRLAPPNAPQQFRVKISDGVALFEWLPAPELDVIIGGHFELRHSSRTSGANWASAQMVIPSIPGSATTAEAIYRVGTWFLKTFDIVGMESAQAAIIIATQPDGRYTEIVRICENPDFLGSRFYTEIKMPQQWLVIGQTGGIWDDQLANMDSWATVDVLAEGSPSPPQSEPRHGWYLFEDRIDAGGVFTVRFSADILAFPFQEGSQFIDDRLDPIDEWNDFDNVGADLGGQVQLFIRTTNNDPASAGAAWSAWQVFAPQEYTARGFEFRADLFAPIGQNIGIETLCIIADLRMKMDSDEDVPYPAAVTHVAFTVKFYLVPAVVITVQNALATDTIQVLNKTRQGFDVSITNAGAQVTRVFDWQARGY